MDMHTPRPGPDDTPYSRFVNDAMTNILDRTPNPADALEEITEQERGQIIMDALAAINAGVLCNIVRDVLDPKVAVEAVSRLASKMFEEIGRLQPQVRRRRK